MDGGRRHRASGLQKWAHGYFRHGEYLAFSLGSAPFRPVLAPFLSAAEYARLTALSGAIGDGPYRVENGLLPLAANATWFTELALAPLLCLRPHDTSPSPWPSR